MKRSEIIDHIHEELKEFISSYESASSKRVPHLIKYKAEELLDMLEGFGMFSTEYYDEFDCDGMISKWEEEK